LAEKPDLHPDLWPVWRGWHDLNAGRPVGMAAGGLPWSEMSQWCEDHGIGGADRLRWCRLFRAMDSAFLAHINKPKERDADTRTTDRRERNAARGDRGRERPTEGEDGG
jgi:hypothetical protein